MYQGFFGFSTADQDRGEPAEPPLAVSPIRPLSHLSSGGNSNVLDLPPAG